MTYRIDPRPYGHDGRPLRCPYEATIVLVGCGGTGAFLADALCRLLIGRAARLLLVDLDRVEPHNLLRQAFDRRAVGRFKAEVLAARLARRYGREIGYAVLPYDPAVHAGFVDGAPSALHLLVGAVDNAAARRAMAATFDARPWHAGYGRVPQPCWWLDAGNARNSGQVLLGNAARPEALRGAFLAAEGRCRALPAPSLQRPDLLVSPPQPAARPALDCAAAVAQDEQGGTINQLVAAVAAGFVEQLLDGTCTRLAAYFDLDDGTLRSVPADPAAVAGIAGLRRDTVAPTPKQAQPEAA